MIECDEIWSCYYSKQKNVPDKQGELGYGDVWTWTAIDADTKLIPTWLVGERTPRRCDSVPDGPKDPAARRAHPTNH